MSESLSLNIFQNLTYKKSICKSFKPTTRALIIPIIYYYSDSQDKIFYYNNQTIIFTSIILFGENFRDYSTILFNSIFVLESYFVNSEQIFFYLPQNLKVGNYSIQVLNDQFKSNIIYYNN